jgi:CAP-Gly domain-containing linker protein 1
MKEEYETRENNLKEILNENDHESECKERQIKQLTSQIEINENDSKQTKALLIKYETENKVLEEKLKTLGSTGGGGGDNEKLLTTEKERDELKEHIEYYQSVVVELQNKIQEYENYFASVQETSEEKPATTRLYCDICDAFDLHDTEDCPQQSMAAKELENHSRHDISKKQNSATRLYCDNCEEFGHDTSDESCPNKNKNDDDDQMF